MFEQDPRITSIAEGENGLFCLYWSHLMEADKYSVSQKIPSVSGIYELYYEDDEKKLNLLTVAPNDGPRHSFYHNTALTHIGH